MLPSVVRARISTGILCWRRAWSRAFLYRDSSPGRLPEARKGLATERIADNSSAILREPGTDEPARMDADGREQAIHNVRIMHRDRGKEATASSDTTVDYEWYTLAILRTVYGSISDGLLRSTRGDRRIG